MVEGLHLRLGLEPALQLAKQEVAPVGVQNGARVAINSVLFQRLQEQIMVL